MTQKQPLHEQIYAQLSQALMAGDFAPGEQLTIRGMAEELGTSMMPVREAVRRLAALKALQVLPKRYVCVTPLTIGAFVDVAEMRKLLEGRATALACEQITKDELRDIKRINKQLLATTRNSRRREMMKLNNQFHISIYRCAHSELLLETIEHLWLRIGPYLSHILADELRRDAKPDQAFERHIELIEGLENHNIERAVAAVHADIDNGTHILLKAINVGYNRQYNQLTLVESKSAPQRRTTRMKTRSGIKKVKN